MTDARCVPPSTLVEHVHNNFAHLLDERSFTSWAPHFDEFATAFEKAGITQVAQLCCLTDEQVQAAGVALVGHRKRLLQAMKELTPPAQGAPLPDSPRRAPRARA